LESEKPVVDFARVQTFTCVIGVGSRGGGGGAKEEGRLPAGPGAVPGPMTGPQSRLRTINTVGSGTPKTAGGGVRGSATGEAQRPSAPGRRFPPVGRHWKREGRARETASSSRVKKQTCSATEGTRSPTGCWVWETTGPLSDAAG